MEKATAEGERERGGSTIAGGVTAECTYSLSRKSLFPLISGQLPAGAISPPVPTCENGCLPRSIYGKRYFSSLAVFSKSEILARGEK